MKFLGVLWVLVVYVSQTHGYCSLTCSNETIMPFCALCDGKFESFPNSCSYKEAVHCNYRTCMIAHPGKCGASEKCAPFCPHVIKPVCAVVGQKFRTFPNYCSLNLHNCLSKDSNYTLVSYCPCIKDTEESVDNTNA